MRIGTWNLDYAPLGKRHAIRQKLAERCADIWILTETRADIIDAPSVSGFTGIHSYEPPVERTSDAQDRWVSIWSRYPILEDVSLSNADRRRTLAALLDLGNSKRLVVYGTVLPWGAEGNAKWDEVINQQSAEWKELQCNHRDSKLCVAGDFNTSFRGETYFTRAGAKALEGSVDEAEMFCPTSGVLVDDKPLIDHFALPKLWESLVSSVEVWPADKQKLSDHSGVVVEIKGI